ncbi:hypothetical protein [Sporomusa malonica]|uniref:Uncharacterized protein n=1 Tax=Sporomusa malonica TaxID=112901 RepID=A0A1W1ZNT6_9FIRM|nr:hypothetical protein [Sporomusa malonica]SMC49882.1 hypothetical protein SAMN04488500_10475 [Sporomusa malonica]
MDWVTEKNSSEIDDIAQDLASSQAGLIVLETREWILPVAVITVEVTLDGYRCPTIIEEFIMKCIASGVSDLKSQQGIGDLLRLDEVFVERHLQELLLCRLLVESEVGGKIIYELTNEGWDAYQTGLMAATHNEIVIVTLNAQYELIDTYRDITDKPVCVMKDLPIFRYFNQQEEKAMRSASPVLDEEAFRIAQRQIEELYAGDLVNSVTEIRESQLEQDVSRHFGEIWVYDAVNNQVFCQVWDFGQKRICEKLTFALNSLENEHRLAQVQKIFNKDVCISPKQPRILETLYGPAIRKAFLQAFNDVQERILIISPCISAIAADDEVLARFRDVVRRKGVIYIGWGGAQTSTNENRLAAPVLMEKLQSIVDAEGAPGVFLFNIGNLANKELLVDRQYHMLDSLHWLSYRGEHIVRNRAVDRIVDKNYVVEKSGCLQGLFLKQLEAQLIEGFLSNQLKCISWFYALLGLNEHSYIREALAEEALEKVIATHSSRILLNILAVYVRAGEYELGFTRLLNCLVCQESNAELVRWLEKLYIRNPQACSKITTICKELFK